MRLGAQIKIPNSKFLIREAFSQLPKRYSRSSGYIQRVHLMRHWDTGYIVGGVDGFLRQTVTFRSHDNGETVLGAELGVINADRIVSQCHCHCLEAKRTQVCLGTVSPCPRHEEDGAHRNADGTAVERIAGVARQQYGVNAESCCRAEDGSDVGGVDNAIDDHHTMGIAADISNRRTRTTAHGAKHATRKGITGQRSKQIAVAYKHGDVAATLYDGTCVALHMTALTHQRHRLITRTQRHINDLWTLSYEKPTVLTEAVAQLWFGQRAEDLNSGMCQGCDIYDWHNS